MAVGFRGMQNIIQVTLGEFVQPKANILRIRPGFYKTVGAYRETPQSGPLGLPAQLCIKQLYAIL